jgi:hypothetical protein
MPPELPCRNCGHMVPPNESCERCGQMMQAYLVCDKCGYQTEQTLGFEGTQCNTPTANEPNCSGTLRWPEPKPVDTSTWDG